MPKTPSPSRLDSLEDKQKHMHSDASMVRFSIPKDFDQDDLSNEEVTNLADLDDWL